LSSAEREVKDLREKLKAIEGKMERAMVEANRLRSECEKLTNDVKELEERQDTLESANKKLREDNKSLETQLFDTRREFLALEKQFSALSEIEKTFNDKLYALQEKYSKALGEQREQSLRIQKFETIKKEILRLLDKNRKQTEDLDSTLSCLSCLEPLADPLTLICGHSICRKCF